MAGSENEQRDSDAGPDLGLEAAVQGIEAEPLAGQFEIRPGEVVAERGEPQLLHLLDGGRGHIAAGAGDAAEALVRADAQQEALIERLRILCVGRI